MPSPSRYAVPRKLADIAPREFLRLERRLFNGKSSPTKRKPSQPYKRYSKVSPDNARRALQQLLRSFQPGDPVGTCDVQRITGYSEPHSRAIIHCLKELKSWPFAPPPETRGRKPRKQ